VILIFYLLTRSLYTLYRVLVPPTFRNIWNTQINNKRQECSTNTYERIISQRLKTSKLKQKPQFNINETNEDVFSGFVGRSVISLGHQVGQKVFWEGPKFFKLPILSNYVQHIFQGRDPTCVPWLRACLLVDARNHWKHIGNHAQTQQEWSSKTSIHQWSRA